MLEEDVTVVESDLQKLLDAAIFQIRYPHVSLDYEGESFVEDLSNDEIQMLSYLMKLEWINRCIATWDNLRQLYSDKDFSQANHLDKLIKLSDQVELECLKASSTYGRSIDGKPYDYTKLAGKKHG